MALSGKDVECRQNIVGIKHSTLTPSGAGQFVSPAFGSSLPDLAHLLGTPCACSRPYKKNDNAWVEQKNWTHVRKVVGYRRFDTTGELRILNEIYEVLRLYKNFCLPTIRLQGKERIGGKIRRSYESPCTPYQRVLDSGEVDRKTKRELRKIYEDLNPAELHRRLTKLRVQLEELSSGKPEGYGKLAYRGPDIRISKRRNPVTAVA